MSATTVSPQRRRRILHAHQLRQTGATTRSIAQVLNVAPSTIHDDLRLLEQHWQEIAQQAAADALLTALGALQISLNSFFHSQPNGANPFAANQRELIMVCRELRQTVNQIHKLQPEDPTQDSSPEPPDYPDDQLADAERHRTPSDTVGQNRTQPNTTEQDRTQSNVAAPPSPDSEPPLSPELFAEALEFIAKHQRLEGDPPPSPPNRAARRAQQRRQRKKSPQPATSR